MELNTNNMKKIMLLIFFAFVLLLSGFYLTTIFSILTKSIALIAPLLIGGCIAFVLNILLRELEKYYLKFIDKNNNLLLRVKRPICVFLTYAIILTVVCLIMFLIVPEISRSFSSIIENFPKYIEQLNNNVTVNEIANKFGFDLNELLTTKIDWNEITKQITTFLSTSSDSFFNKTLDITTSVVGTITTIGLSFVFSVYMLIQKEKLADQFRRIIYAFFPRKHVCHILNVGELSNRIFSNFVMGQLIEAVIIGVMCFVGMIIFRMPYATMISTLVAFTALIPVVGAFAGTAIGAFLILLVNPIQAVWFVVYIIVIQQIDGNFIYPKVVGKSVGLPGLWVLAAVVIGGSSFGVLGMLLGVPIFSIVYSILKSVVAGRLKEDPIEVCNINSIKE